MDRNFVAGTKPRLAVLDFLQKNKAGTEFQKKFRNPAFKFQEKLDAVLVNIFFRDCFRVEAFFLHDDSLLRGLLSVFQILDDCVDV